MNCAALFTNVVQIPDDPTYRVLIATFEIFVIAYMLVIARRALWSFKRQRVIAAMNVRIVRHDEVLKCRVVYVGLQDDLDTYVVVEPVAEPGDALLCDMLPPQTQLIGMGVA